MYEKGGRVHISSFSYINFHLTIAPDFPQALLSRVLYFPASWDVCLSPRDVLSLVTPFQKIKRNQTTTCLSAFSYTLWPLPELAPNSFGVWDHVHQKHHLIQKQIYYLSANSKPAHRMTASSWFSSMSTACSAEKSISFASYQPHIACSQIFLKHIFYSQLLLIFELQWMSLFSQFSNHRPVTTVLFLLWAG